MHKNYFCEVITTNPALFTAMLRCNGIATTDALPFPADLAKTFPDLPAPLLEELWHHAPSQKHVRGFVAETGTPCWDFAEESRRLALLEPELVDELALFYGAALHAPEIAQTIMNKDISLLRAELGDRVYAYALQRGQYQAPLARSVFANRHRGKPLAERVVIHGKEALGTLVAAWPPSLQHRLSVTPPADLDLPVALQISLWFDMKKILLREVAPAWTPCFS